MDDILVAGNDSTSISTAKQLLADKFRIKDLGPLKYFLGLKVARSHTDIFISQSKFALKILFDLGQLGARIFYFPVEQKLQFHDDERTPLSNPRVYRHLIGHLIISPLHAWIFPLQLIALVSLCKTHVMYTFRLFIGYFVV